jgi:hypothetical protein
VRTAALTLATASALILSGCAAEAPATTTLTITETKSSVQLMRNAVSGKIDPSYIAEVREVTDKSETCQNDPESKMRLWRSGSVIELNRDDSDNADDIRQAITADYTDQGWRKEVETSDTQTVVTLINPRSLATIEVTVKEPDPFLENGAIFVIDIAGPCVLTEGPGSAELRRIGG